MRKNMFYIKDTEKKEIINLNVFDRFSINECDNSYTVEAAVMTTGVISSTWTLLETDDISVAEQFIEEIAEKVQAREADEEGYFEFIWEAKRRKNSVGTNSENE